MSGTTGIVTFSYPQWATRYPELASSVSSALANAYFAEAELLVDNTAMSRICDTGQRALILNMLVSHIAALNAPLNGQASSPLVGRISSATEGSVSVSTEMPALPGSAAYFAQTKYGLSAWQAMAAYRTFRYVPRPCAPNASWGAGYYGRRV